MFWALPWNLKMTNCYSTFINTGWGLSFLLLYIFVYFFIKIRPVQLSIVIFYFESIPKNDCGNRKGKGSRYDKLAWGRWALNILNLCSFYAKFWQYWIFSRYENIRTAFSVTAHVYVSWRQNGKMISRKIYLFLERRNLIKCLSSSGSARGDCGHISYWYKYLTLQSKYLFCYMTKKEQVIFPRENFEQTSIIQEWK